MAKKGKKSKVQDGKTASGTQQPLGSQPPGSLPTSPQPAGSQPTGSQPSGSPLTGSQPAGSPLTGSQPAGSPPTGSQPPAAQSVPPAQPGAAQTTVSSPATSAAVAVSTSSPGVAGAGGNSNAALDFSYPSPTASTSNETADDNTSNSAAASPVPAAAGPSVPQSPPASPSGGSGTSVAGTVSGGGNPPGLQAVAPSDPQTPGSSGSMPGSPAAQSAISSAAQESASTPQNTKASDKDSKKGDNGNKKSKDNDGDDKGGSGSENGGSLSSLAKKLSSWKDDLLEEDPKEKDKTKDDTSGGKEKKSDKGAALPSVTSGAKATAPTDTGSDLKATASTSATPGAIAAAQPSTAPGPIATAPTSPALGQIAAPPPSIAPEKTEQEQTEQEQKEPASLGTPASLETTPPDTTANPAISATEGPAVEGTTQKNIAAQDTPDSATDAPPVGPASTMIKPEDVQDLSTASATAPPPVTVAGAPKLRSTSPPKGGNFPYSIDQLLQIVFEKDASDLHVTVGYPAMIRVDGQLVPVSDDIIGEEDVEKLIVPVLPENKRELLEVNREVDLAYSYQNDARFRINAFYTRGRMSAAFRLIPNDIRSIEDLRLPGTYHQLAKLAQGLVLVTGPTGSGKSTTLAAILQEVNLNYPKHIITIEDPIEYVYPPARALVDQREMHEDTHSWEIALRSAMREDPDVVLVGEMRDFETIAAAITLAETGHLVFATLHTNSAAQTVDRLIDVFPEHQQSQVRTQVATILEAVIAQRLIPMRAGGRRAVSEILLCTSAVRNLIREGKTHQLDNVIRTSLDVGMKSLEHSLVELVREGVITVEDAESIAVHPEEVTRLLK